MTPVSSGGARTQTLHLLQSLALGLIPPFSASHIMLLPPLPRLSQAWRVPPRGLDAFRASGDATAAHHTHRRPCWVAADPVNPRREFGKARPAAPRTSRSGVIFAYRF